MCQLRVARDSKFLLKQTLLLFSLPCSSLSCELDVGLFFVGTLCERRAKNRGAETAGWLGGGPLACKVIPERTEQRKQALRITTFALPPTLL